MRPGILPFGRAPPPLSTSGFYFSPISHLAFFRFLYRNSLSLSLLDSGKRKEKYENGFSRGQNGMENAETDK